VESQRLLLRSTRGVAQEIEFHVAPQGAGYCVKATHRIDGCYPKPGPCMMTPLPLEAAMTWANARAAKLARSAAAFRPAKTVEDHIAELFGL